MNVLINGELVLYSTVGNVRLFVDRESSFTQLDVANALAKGRAR